MRDYKDNSITLIQSNKMVCFATQTPVMHDWSQIPFVVKYNIDKTNIRSCKNMTKWVLKKLPDGTKKIEKVPLTQEEIEEIKRLNKKYEEIKKKQNERHKITDEKRAIRKGFKNLTEFERYRREEIAKRQGYNNYNEYQRAICHAKGKTIPMDINKECSEYLGIYIAENILPDIFENPKMMPYRNRGYDALCKNGYKIDVKSSCLHFDKYKYRAEYFRFHIDENKIADYFLMFGFDNRENLNLLHMWLIKGDEIVRGIKLNNKTGLSISNLEKILKKFEKYELKDKIDKAIKICDKFKIENLKQIKYKEDIKYA